MSVCTSGGDGILLYGVYIDNTHFLSLFWLQLHPLQSNHSRKRGERRERGRDRLREET